MLQELTTHLYRNLCASGTTIVKVLGIDIDKTLVQRANEGNLFPEFIQYICLDITDDNGVRSLSKYLMDSGRKAFDITFCFSVTMWIHLNHGDSGLKQFLETVSGITNYLFLEAQPWKCYRNASRRMRRMNLDKFQDLHTLSMNANVVQNIDCVLQGKCGMHLIECFGQTHWQRKVTLYKNSRVLY